MQATITFISQNFLALLLPHLWMSWSLNLWTPVSKKRISWTLVVILFCCIFHVSVSKLKKGRKCSLQDFHLWLAQKRWDLWWVIFCGYKRMWQSRLLTLWWPWSKTERGRANVLVSSVRACPLVMQISSTRPCFLKVPSVPNSKVNWSLRFQLKSLEQYLKSFYIVICCFILFYLIDVYCWTQRPSCFNISLLVYCANSTNCLPTIFR